MLASVSLSKSLHLNLKAGCILQYYSGNNESNSYVLVHIHTLLQDIDSMDKGC